MSSMAGLTGGRGTSMVSLGGSTIFDAQMSGRSYKDYDLRRKDHIYYFPDKDALLERDVIPATKIQRLAYLMSYTTPPDKLIYSCSVVEPFSEFIVTFLLDSLGMTTPLIFMYVFLGAYVPDQHMFLNKMAPIASGWEYLLLLAGYMELIRCMERSILLIDFIIQAAIFQNLFYRCEPKFVIEGDTTVYCYTIDEFRKKHINESIHFSRTTDIFTAYESDRHYRLSTAAVFGLPSNEDVVYQILFLIVWGLILITNRKIFSEGLWKIFLIINVLYNVVLAFCFVRLLQYYFDNVNTVPVRVPHTTTGNLISGAGFDFLAQATVSPPLIHLFTSRSSEEISPDWDSSILTIWIMIHAFFRIILSFLLKNYSENELQMAFPGYSCKKVWFTMWPVFFRVYYYGNFIVILFYSLNFLNDMCVTVITCHAFIEVVACEWDMKKWMIILIMFVLAICVITTVSVEVWENVYFVYKAAAQTMEALIVTLLYPLQRLTDDMKFVYGRDLNPFRMWNFRIMAVYVFYKTYHLLKAIIQVSLLRDRLTVLVLLYLTGILIFLVLGGMSWAIYSMVNKSRQSWKALFRPINDWGPKEYLNRQLRKKYDARTYVKSTANRDISRYLIKKSMSRVYRLDLRYGAATRASRQSVAMSFSIDRRASSRHYF